MNTTSEKHMGKRDQIAREKDLYVYANALERGDFAALENVLEQAADDPDLEQMIFELHEAYEDEREGTSPAVQKV